MLHGDLKVNDVKIGDWEIVNQKEILDGAAVYEYKVEINYRDINGTRKRGRFTVTHRHGDGALVLIGKVFTEAAAHMRSIPLGDDGYPVD